MKLREKLKEQAETELAEIKLESTALLNDLHPIVTGEELATLAFGKRTATLEKAVVRRMVDYMEELLFEKYADQLELEVADDA